MQKISKCSSFQHKLVYNGSAMNKKYLSQKYNTHNIVIQNIFKFPSFQIK
jgi:hypothetical protein